MGARDERDRVEAAGRAAGRGTARRRLAAAARADGRLHGAAGRGDRDRQRLGRWSCSEACSAAGLPFGVVLALAIFAICRMFGGGRRRPRRRLRPPLESGQRPPVPDRLGGLRASGVRPAGANGRVGLLRWSYGHGRGPGRGENQSGRSFGGIGRLEQTGPTGCYIRRRAAYRGGRHWSWRAWEPRGESKRPPRLGRGTRLGSGCAAGALRPGSADPGRVAGTARLGAGGANARPARPDLLRHAVTATAPSWSCPRPPSRRCSPPDTPPSPS